jgi:hypothetical protein
MTAPPAKRPCPGCGRTWLAPGQKCGLCGKTQRRDCEPRSRAGDVK